MCEKVRLRFFDFWSTVWYYFPLCDASKIDADRGKLNVDLIRPQSRAKIV
jgi:hypothetical protein